MLTEDERVFLSSLYQRFYRNLLSYSCSLLKSFPDAMSIAEECVQETFLAAIDKIPYLQQHSSPYGWLINTCKNITISQRRKLLNRSRLLGFPVSIELVSSAADPHNDIEDWILREELFEGKQLLLDMLTREEQSVYHAFYEERMSIRAAAQHLNVSEAAVSGALHRIRAKGKALFGK